MTALTRETQIFILILLGLWDERRRNWGECFWTAFDLALPAVAL